MTGRDAERDAVLDDLAFVLHGQGCGEVCVCVDDARLLLPEVDRIANERAAAALEAAAEDVESTHAALNCLGAGVTRLNDLLAVETDLRDRAAALRAADGEAGT